MSQRDSRWDEIHRTEGFLRDGLQAFGSEGRFVRARQSPEYSEVIPAFSFEHTHEILLSELLGLGKDLLREVTGDPDDRRLDGDETITKLGTFGHLSQGEVDLLHEFRRDRNVLQHQHSMSLPQGVWKDSQRLLQILPSIKRKFERAYRELGSPLPRYE